MKIIRYVGVMMFVTRVLNVPCISGIVSKCQVENEILCRTYKKRLDPLFHYAENPFNQNDCILNLLKQILEFPSKRILYREKIEAFFIAVFVGLEIKA